MAKQVLIFWGFKVANFCQEVLNFVGSYTQVFTVCPVSDLFTDFTPFLKLLKMTNAG